MIEINGNTITMTRGNTLKAHIGLKLKGTETPYVPQSGDSIGFMLKPLPYDESEPVLEKSIDMEALHLELDPEDTAELPCGEYAYWLTMVFADGQVDTFADALRLTLIP